MAIRLAGEGITVVIQCNNHLAGARGGLAGACVKRIVAVGRAEGGNLLSRLGSGRHNRGHGDHHNQRQQSGQDSFQFRIFHAHTPRTL